jgi:acyl-CoA dehydrogenase
MSLPYLINSAGGHIPASERIPTICKPWVSDRAKKTLDIVSASDVF